MQRSTEQLTRCSTATLEQVLDNSDGQSTRTVSQKIMSFCKKNLRWILLVDILLALSVIVLLTILEFGTVPRQLIGFYCNDPKISFKFMGDTVSIALLIAGSILIPLIVMWLVEYSCHPTECYKVSGCAGSRTKQVWLWFGQYTIGLIALTFICDVIKVLISEPRPHFLDTCKPREALNCTNEYVGAYTCTNSIDSDWFVSDSSKSFPSGHSALSMFTSIFTVWYLQSRLPNRTWFLKPWLQCLICMWTLTCSLTRIGDNRHHWWDVLAGDIFGLILAMLTVAIPCRKFELSRKVSQISNEPLENGQISFNEKKHRSTKKLLSEQTVDIPEGRELKNITHSWKE